MATASAPSRRLASHVQPVYDGLTGWDVRRHPERIEDIMLYRDESLSLFIDGSNLYAATKALGFDIDY